jgi:hypothetical protein
MTKRDKLLQRFSTLPRDFTWQELVTLLAGFGYREAAGGKTGGSRVKFLHDTRPPIILHKPHPTTVLKRYQMEQIRELLRGERLL